MESSFSAVSGLSCPACQTNFRGRDWDLPCYSPSRVIHVKGTAHNSAWSNQGKYFNFDPDEAWDHDPDERATYWVRQCRYHQDGSVRSEEFHNRHHNLQVKVVIWGISASSEGQYHGRRDPSALSDINQRARGPSAAESNCGLPRLQDKCRNSILGVRVP